MTETLPFEKVDPVLLLTATINPKQMTHVLRTDPKARERDYLEALKLYLENTALDILFCENSNFFSPEICELKSRFPDRSFEILQFDGNKFDPNLGKGRGEKEIIEFALKHSKLFHERKYFLKVTGRLYIKNVAKLAKCMSERSSFICGDLHKNLRWMNSKVFFFHREFFESYFDQVGGRIDDSKGVYFEHCLAAAALRAVSDGRKWVGLPVFPLIVGVSGTLNRKLKGRYPVFLEQLAQIIKNRLLRRGESAQ